MPNDLSVNGPWERPNIHNWPSFGLSSFTRIYDNDMIQVTQDVSLNFHLDLCSRAYLPMPCTLTIAGVSSAISSSNAIRLLADSTITCDAESGCTGLTVKHVKVTRSSSISNKAVLDISGDGARITIDHTVFEDCIAEKAGGSVRALNGAVLDVTNSLFLRSSSSTSNGGAMAIVGANALIVDSQFTDCAAPQGRGGALYVAGFSSYASPVRPSTVRLEGCQFSRNDASEGGSLAVVTESTKATIVDCTFEENSATQSGGAASMIDSSQATISGSTFDNNQASGHGGGALHASSSTLELGTNSFVRNSAPGGGGGALLWNGKGRKQSAHLMDLDAVGDVK